MGSESGFMEEGFNIVLRGNSLRLNKRHGEDTLGTSVFDFPDGFHASISYFIDGEVAGIGGGIGERFGGSC